MLDRSLNSSFRPSFLFLTFVILPLSLHGGPNNVATAQDRQVLFIAGAPSHGFGDHEHLGGSTLLSQTINEANIGVNARVISGWPADESEFDNVDAIVIYSDGGRGHPVMRHLDTFRELMDRGVGFSAIHYAVEVPPGEAGDLFIETLGGYFETHWSVNPFWTGDFRSLPSHPASNGVDAFEIRDEWYYHMRFTDGMEGITPLLSDLPPKESLSRPDGPHSNNSHVREAVMVREEPQHVAWTYDRPNGGRSFGFTGAHSHWNWGVNDFRRLVANAIVWTTGADVPDDGIPVQPVTAVELRDLTDGPVPAGWDPEAIQAMIDEANE